MVFEVEPGSIIDGVQKTLWYIIHDRMEFKQLYDINIMGKVVISFLEDYYYTPACSHN